MTDKPEQPIAKWGGKIHTKDMRTPFKRLQDQVNDIPTENEAEVPMEQVEGRTILMLQKHGVPRFATGKLSERQTKLVTEYLAWCEKTGRKA